ncbi:MAG: indole-3-glycerol phosphate synthase TrpC [Chloroflexi bacterium]|nr:indole-3-glycerol phosphate synthase TrpC [Chloroflexota bacterium]
MPTILDRIVEAKRRELEQQRARVPLTELERRCGAMPPPLNFSGALWGQDIRLIAEVKKASPSRGLLRADFDPVALARSYAENGAAAVSVLTDAHFQGELAHLVAVKEVLRPTGVPVLRKDFVYDPYQLWEARAAGADAVLLIVAILSLSQLKELLSVAASLWLQCLVEVHDKAELQVALEAGAEVIGVNNRDLRTFQTDLAVTERLAKLVPKGKILVSESGIFTRQDMLRLRKLGVHAALVGEAIVTAPDPGAKVRELLGLPVRVT